jgi:hypothetical protein
MLRIWQKEVEIVKASHGRAEYLNERKKEALVNSRKAAESKKGFWRVQGIVNDPASRQHFETDC